MAATKKEHNFWSWRLPICPDWESTEGDGKQADIMSSPCFQKEKRGSIRYTKIHFLFQNRISIEYRSKTDSKLWKLVYKETNTKTMKQ